MDAQSLDEFRRRWQEELAQAQAQRKRRRPEGAERRGRRPDLVPGRGEQASGYLALAQGLLEGAGRPPAPRSARAEASRSRSPPARDGAGPGPGEQLVDQLIRDLNEMDDVPFFDIQLPYELAINIFQYLNRKELGRCAQVSKTWKVIAEDEVLWYRLCQQEGHLPESSISDYSCWKLIFQECRAREHMLRTNWKNRKGAVSELEHVPDAVLCDVHSHDGVVIAGYTSGDVRVWDTRTWDYIAPFLESEYEEDEPGMQPYVSFVRINSSLAVAAYEDGFLNIWDLRAGKYPTHRFEHDARIQALALSKQDATIATASAFDVVMLGPNEEGYWQITAEFEVQKLVDYLEIVPDTGRYPVAVATAGDLVYLLKAEDSARTLHYVYGQPVTCLDVSASQAAFGVKSLGWVYEGNKGQDPRPAHRQDRPVVVRAPAWSLRSADGRLENRQRWGGGPGLGVGLPHEPEAVGGALQTPRPPHLLQQPQPHHSPRALRARGAQRRAGQLLHAQEAPGADPRLRVRGGPAGLPERPPHLPLVPRHPCKLQLRPRLCLSLRQRLGGQGGR
ncbi:F-box/WD repeat-containing protein 8 isoform X2 [Erinaceus europaeus]|uniref:F-box/WD repeat-containing protein 8 isoform X2 n=1 Tax=Erinaceus europaeus TaxID=9365 RepID=A0ABM3XJJ8_ERIEU|nr:F-box/WD repeat-containing protein 8 isoform X2 [Erinaceus europaeus]